MSKGWTRLFCLLLPPLCAALLLAACGGGDEDETAPKLTLTEVGESASTTVRSHTLAGTVEVGAFLTVSVDTAPSGAKIVDLDADTSDGNWSCIVSNLAPGPNIVTIQAEDKRGNLASITVNLLYDALSIASWVSPIPDNATVIGGLFDPALDLSGLVMTVGSTTLDNSLFVVSGNRWSLALDGLATGDNVVTLSLPVPEATDPAEATVTINVNASAPVVTIDPPVAPFTADMTVAGARSSGVSVVVAAPTATVGTVDLTTDPLRWSCPLTGLDRGKNAVTATAAAGGVTATAHELIVLP